MLSPAIPPWFRAIGMSFRGGIGVGSGGAASDVGLYAASDVSYAFMVVAVGLGTRVGL